MSATPEKNSLLILGSGEIARMLATLAQHGNYTILVCDDQAGQHDWPKGTAIKTVNFGNQPWQLADTTHAVIARGHDGDAENLLALLTHGAGHVYLIASAARAQNIVDQVKASLPGPELIDRLSAPAGLDIGGRSSYEIALSILAEIQWRMHGANPIQPLTALRANRLQHSVSGQRNQSCPGKRP